MEAPELYARAAIGLAGGAWKYYIRPEITARRTWAAIGVAVVAHEVLCPKGQLLSEGADRLIDKYPLAKAGILLSGLIITTHVANALPERVDPFKRALELMR